MEKERDVMNYCGERKKNKIKSFYLNMTTKKMKMENVEFDLFRELYLNSLNRDILNETIKFMGVACRWKIMRTFITEEKTMCCECFESNVVITQSKWDNLPCHTMICDNCMYSHCDKYEIITGHGFNSFNLFICFNHTCYILKDYRIDRRLDSNFPEFIGKLNYGGIINLSKIPSSYFIEGYSKEFKERVKRI